MPNKERNNNLMKAYIIYMTDDCENNAAIAITSDKTKAVQYVKECENKDEYWRDYRIATVKISNEITTL